MGSPSHLGCSSFILLPLFPEGKKRRLCSLSISVIDFDADNASETLYFLATSAAKISILMFYLRIFTGRKFKIIAWALILVCVQYGVSTAIATVFGCRPISAAWQTTLEQFTCIDKLALYYANTGLGIFIDFSTFLLPL